MHLSDGAGVGISLQFGWIVNIAYEFWHVQDRKKERQTDRQTEILW